MSKNTTQFKKIQTEKLLNLLGACSKHCTYQEIHPDLKQLLDLNNYPSGKSESSRWDYMLNHLDWSSKRVLDIGANTGYFSIAAIKANASEVVAIEGNSEHAEFIRLTTEMVDCSQRLTVENRYFDFEEKGSHFDIVLCLNVLHHLGDDFGDQHLSIEQAKYGMAKNLQDLAQIARHCWFQLGFNWKGDRNSPLFAKGLKSELVEFVEQACSGYWTIKDIAIFNPDSQIYERGNHVLMERFNEIGEFLNRPLFLLESSL